MRFQAMDFLGNRFKMKTPSIPLNPSLLLTTQEAFVDSVDHDQTEQNVNSDLHSPHFHSRL